MSYQFYNIKTGQFLFNSYGNQTVWQCNQWDTFKLISDPNNSNTLFDFEINGSKVRIKSGGEYMMPTFPNLSQNPANSLTDLRWWPNSYGNGYCAYTDPDADYFQLVSVNNSSITNLDAYNSGPFVIQNIKYPQKAIGISSSPSYNGMYLVKMVDFNPQDTSQQWINYNNISNSNAITVKACNSLGITDLENCNSSYISSCDRPWNQNDFSKCPMNFCTNTGNVNTPQCKTWCNANPGVCDQTAISYCQVHSSDTDFCGCINVPKDLGNYGLKPECNLSSCASNANAFKIKNMSGSSCPTVNLCNQSLSTAGLTKSQLQNVNFTCNNTSTSTTSPSTAISTSTTTSPSTTSPSISTATSPPDNSNSSSNYNDNNKIALYIILGVYIVLIILLLIYFSRQ